MLYLRLGADISHVCRADIAARRVYLISYDVTPDGQRFLVLEPVESEVAPVTHLNVVLNWFEEVKRKTGSEPVQRPR